MPFNPCPSESAVFRRLFRLVFLARRTSFFPALTVAVTFAVSWIASWITKFRLLQRQDCQPRPLLWDASGVCRIVRHVLSPFPQHPTASRFCRIAARMLAQVCRSGRVFGADHLRALLPVLVNVADVNGIIWCRRLLFRPRVGADGDGRLFGQHIP